MSKKTLYIFIFLPYYKRLLCIIMSKRLFIYIFLLTKLSKYYEFMTSIFVNGYKFFYCI